MDNPILSVPTSFGVESIASREIRDLGYEIVSVEDGRISFRGDADAICRCNIWLRTAERVQIKMGEFSAVTFDELFEGTKAMRWGDILPRDAEFPVSGHSLKSKLFSVPDCQSIIKRAIVDKLTGKYKITSFPEDGELYKIQFNILKDRVSVYIDTTGEGLHKRGYRQDSNIAPIRETLAAAIVRLSRWKPGQAFWDPYCGSGTFVIEAAMIGMNMAPGCFRGFTSEKWGIIDKRSWVRAREEAKSQILVNDGVEIVGSDIDKHAVESSRRNAKRARVSVAVKFFQLDAGQMSPNHERLAELGVKLPEVGCIVGNPPYGDRLPDLTTAECINKKLGERYRLFDNNNWRLYIITSNDDFEKNMNRTAKKKRKLYNGMTKCNLYQYF